MAGVLVIGIGNPLRGDDGIGWRAASELASRFDDESVEVLPCHQLTPELAERVAAARRVIFVDAAIGRQPGLIRCRPVQAGAAAPSSFSHHLTPPLLLRYSWKIFGARPRAVQLTVTAQNFEYGEEFSASVAAAFPQLLRTILILARQEALKSRPTSEFAAPER